MIKQDKWHQLIVPYEELSGTNILALLKCIMDVKQFKFVILNNIELNGGSEFMHILQNKNLMEVKDLMFILPDIKQFGWGDFFLFKEYPESSEESEKVTDLINQTDITIRAIDYYYMFVYTPNNSVVKTLKKNYEIEKTKTGCLENLNYPS